MGLLYSECTSGYGKPGLVYKHGPSLDDACSGWSDTDGSGAPGQHVREWSCVYACEHSPRQYASLRLLHPWSYVRWFKGFPMLMKPGQTYVFKFYEGKGHWR